VKPVSFSTKRPSVAVERPAEAGYIVEMAATIYWTYTVVEQVGPVDYRIRRSVKSKAFIVHVDKLRPYLSPAITEGRMTPSNTQGVQLADEVASTDDDETQLEFWGRPRRVRRLPTRYQN